jgi:hypothetical protein
VTKDSNDETEMGDNRCVDCGKLPPPTDTSYTLISTRHGWRLTRAVDKDGQRIMEWRCPSCWQIHRKKLTP